MTVAVDLSASSSGTLEVVPAAVLIGEIHTGILQNSAAVTTETAIELLGLISHQPVRTWERPVRHASSPEVLTGVDCHLPSATATSRRVVGTVGAEVRITAGRVLQAAARGEVARSRSGRRLTWSHYLTRPAALEVLGELQPADLVGGFLDPADVAGTLDLGGICAGLLGQVQTSPAVDRRAPLRASRTRLRWTATPVVEDRPATLRFAVEDDGLRTLDIAAPPAVLAGVPALCQDVALHDWLLSTVIALVDVADIGRRRRADVVRRLAPAVDNLLHAWLPGARVPAAARPLWTEIERVSGLTRQWEIAMQRIRDQIALAVVEQTMPPEPG